MEPAGAHLVRAGLMIVGAKGLSDLDLAIGRLRRKPWGAHDSQPRLQLLASAFQIRHRLTNEPGDLDRCGRYLTEIIDGLADDHPHRTETEAWLGRILLDRAAGRPGRDLDAAVRLLENAVAQLPGHRSALRDLGEALTVQWRDGDLNAQERLIAVGRTLLGLEPGNSENALVLARALAERRPRSTADRDEAIALLSKVEVADSGRLVLAGLLAGRALDAGGVDVEEALELLTRLVDSPDLSADERDMAKRVLGGLRELWGGAPHQRYRAALAVTDASDPTYPELVVRVAANDRTCGRAPDVEQLRRLYDRLGPGHLLAGEIFAELGLALPDPQEAALASAEALSRLDLGHPLRGQLILSLAEALSELDAPLAFPDSVLGTADGLFRGLVLIAGRRAADDAWAVARLEEALAALPAGHRLRAPLLVLLGTRLAWRAEVLGDMEVLDVADRHLEAAIGCRPDALRLRVVRSIHRVIMARRRCLPGLVDDAISALESDLAELSTADPWYPRTLWALGEAWWTRGTFRDAAHDRQRGLDLVIAAEAALPGDHPDRHRMTGALQRAQTVLSRPDPPAGSDPAGRG